VLNGFLQAITGLFDYATIAHDRTARSLWRAGDRAARRELPKYDTGRWSRYSMGGPESSLSYHQLATQFLGNLCKRLHGTYCVYHDRFQRYLGKKPEVRYTGSKKGTYGAPLRLGYTVSKASCVTAEVFDSKGTIVFRDRRKVARGAHSLKWTPAARGKYTLTIQAVDQNKNTTSPDFKIVIG
jgi:hypothetical protein